CSSNRVYVDVAGDLTYQAWLAGLREGRTFITDGPILRLTVAGHGPSNEVVADGTVVWREENAAGARSGTVRTSIDASVGWVAARSWGRTRNSYDHAQWAHTSPVYVRDTPGP